MPADHANDVVALEPEVIAAKLERRAAVDEAGRISSRRNEPMRLVSGVVRDAAGQPVQDAVVLVTEVRGPGPPEEHIAILASGQSDESGRFEVRTTVRPSGLEAHASKVGYLDSPLAAFRPGASGLILVLDRGGVVSGRLLLDRWMKLEDVDVELSTRTEDGAKPTSIRVRTSDEEGHFGATGIGASTMELTVRVAGEWQPAFTIPDVAVWRVDEVPDARLDPLDLRGKFEIFTVDVLDDLENGVTGARVTMSDPGSGANMRTQSTVFGGHAEFLTRAVAHDVEIESEGFRRTRLDSVYGNQVVRLRKAIPVCVRVRGSDARPAPPDLLAVGFLVRAGDSIGGLRNGRASAIDGIGRLSDPHETTFFVASPGIHSVAWFLQSGKSPLPLATGSNVTVDVLDQDALQEIVLDLPEQAEKAWIEAARRKAALRFTSTEVR